MEPQTPVQPRSMGLRLRHSMALLALLALLIGAALAVSACGGSSGGGGQGNAGAAGSSPSDSANSGALAFAECMRANGITNFPDPPSAGGPAIAPSGLDPTSPQFLNAENACAHLEKGGNPGTSAQGQRELLKFAHCMRSHGITNFPDPNSSGGFSLPENADFSSTDPQYVAAQQACQSFLPGAS